MRMCTASATTTRHVHADQLALIDEDYVVFVVATTGNGEFPAPARDFWRFILRAGLPPDTLSDLHYATFGLGDSSYARYCWAARMLNRRLAGLGAREFLPAGEADDQHALGVDGELEPWLERFTAWLDEKMPLPAGVTPIPDSEMLPPQVTAHVEEAGAPAAAPPLPTAVVERNERMTAADHFQDVRLVAVSGAGAFRPGDVAALLPENDPARVSALLERLGWADDADKRLVLHTQRALPPSLAEECACGSLTLRRLLTHHLDPFGVAQRSFFELLRFFCPQDHMEHERLCEFLQPGEGTDDMYAYAQRERRTMAEVLDEFRSADVPLAYAAELFPFMRERQYSIASDGGAAELAVAVVHYRTRIRAPRIGTASAWLARVAPGTRIRARIVPGTLDMPDVRTPVVAIGPGTGIAPIRSLMRARVAAGAADELNYVFAGCRDRAKDFLFGAEWEALADKGAVRLHVAPSREQAHKIYVQDRLREAGAHVWDAVAARRGAVYLCGSSGRMPEQVRAAFQELAQTHGGLDAEQAERYMRALERDRRWQEECW